MSEAVRIRLPSALRLGFVAIGVVVSLAGCRGQVEDDPAPAPTNAPMVPTRLTTRSGPPLGPADPFPPLTAAGWLNGPPPSPTATGTQLTVVDVWANWCPVCRQAAPELLRLYRKHSDRGVAFVSVTNMTKDSVEEFVREFAIPWVNGYQLSPETLAALGVSSGMPMPGYDIAPTVYLVGPDGRVRWSDQKGRFRHNDPKHWARQLDEAIEAALALAPATQP